VSQDHNNNLLEWENNVIEEEIKEEEEKVQRNFS